MKNNSSLLIEETRKLRTEYTVEERKHKIKDSKFTIFDTLKIPRTLEKLQECFIDLAGRNGLFPVLEKGDVLLELPKISEQKETRIGVECFLNNKYNDILENTISSILESTVAPGNTANISDSKNKLKKWLEEKNREEYTTNISRFIEAYSRIENMENERDKTHQVKKAVWIADGIINVIKQSTKRSSILQDTWIAVKQILNRTRSMENVMQGFLESQFFNYVKNTVKNTPHGSILSSIPLAEEQIRVFCMIKRNRVEQSWVEMVEGIPIWMEMFYLMRCGMWKEVISYVSNNGDESMKNYITQYYNNGFILPEELRRRVRMEYTQRKNMSRQDEYRSAILVIIGSIEININELPKYTTTIEDHIWHQINLCRGERSLHNLKNIVRDIVCCNLSNDGDEMISFQLLLLSGEFNDAILYLKEKKGFRTDFLNFGLILIMGNVITDPKMILDVLEETEDFANLRVSLGDEKTGIDYMITCIELSDELPKDTLFDRLCEVLNKTKSPSSWFIDSDNINEEGYLFNLWRLFGSMSNITDIAELCGDRKQKEGFLEEAVKLYHVSKKYTKTIKAVCSLLVRNIKRYEQTGEFLTEGELYLKVFTYYQNNDRIKIEIKPEDFDIFSVLIVIGNAIVDKKEGNYMSAIQQLENIGVIAKKTTDDPAIPDLSIIPSEIIDCFPCLITITVDCLELWYKDIIVSGINEATCISLNDIRSYIPSVLLIASFLQTRVSKATFKKLDGLTTI
eukprot:GHVP01026373.1.p1 GENE.GHVP01026373.1~~GHVP01026373.1.p1  ORF type:complete len:740 (+),score=121.31 GHVP01026373.1:469-2688(+)